MIYYLSASAKIWKNKLGRMQFLSLFGYPLPESIIIRISGSWDELEGKGCWQYNTFSQDSSDFSLYFVSFSFKKKSVRHWLPFFNDSETKYFFFKMGLFYNGKTHCQRSVIIGTISLFRMFGKPNLGKNWLKEDWLKISLQGNYVIIRP